MKIAVAKEIDPSEPRVAASPDTVKRFKALGAEVAVEPGAGVKSGLPDSEFTAAGAEGRRHHHQGEAARGQRVGAVQAWRAGGRHHGPIWQ